MKRKLLFLAILLLAMATTLTAQVKLGLRGGINASKLQSKRVIETDDFRIKVPDYLMLGYHVGLIGQIQIGNFFVQPEALYTLTRNDIDIEVLDPSNPSESDGITQKLNRIDIPVLAGLKFNAFKVNAGPVMTFLISDDSDLNKIRDYDLKLNRATIGYQVGVGFDISRFAIDLKYEGSLSKVSDGVNIGNSEVKFNQRINQFILSLGFFF